MSPVVLFDRPKTLWLKCKRKLMQSLKILTAPFETRIMIRMRQRRRRHEAEEEAAGKEEGKGEEKDQEREERDQAAKKAHHMKPETQTQRVKDLQHLQV